MSEFEEAAAAELAGTSERDASCANVSTTTMEEYLKSWGLPMYIDKFKEHSIDIDTLQLLSGEDLKELVPVIGHRAKLITQIAILKDIITDAFSKKAEEDENDAVKTIYLIEKSSCSLEAQPDEQPPTEINVHGEQEENCVSRVIKLGNSY
ncbi:uncharacterized protein LOC125240442 [Leguminivora glycinivorella]|uniref:uncharacterized protein LOC125240442 n=1 Tax=Leguminivora glycinivorella TaxID=1035111 RepID=UPI00200C2CA8|nr:uncharacterized protein LOC125240442 [Leguminivora glycinivorella]